MRKSVGLKPQAAVFLLLLLGILACLACPVLAEGDLKHGADGGNDADRANMFSVRLDYFKRFPHAKVAEDVRKGGRIPDSSKTLVEAKYTMRCTGQELTIPAGPLISAETGPPSSPDPYIAVRPQYRPLYAYCGSPGAFIPEPQPGMLGNYVKNYSKVAKGEGGAVVKLPPTMPTCYLQPLLQFDNGPLLSQEGDQSIWEYELTTFGVGPVSDTQFQMLDREANQRFLELLFDPERWLWSSRALAIMQQQQMSTNLANTADWCTNTANDTISEMLINVANENAATPVSGSPPEKTKSQAIYMVQKMYKHVFLMMGILLLLPGAVMTQMKGMIQGGFMGGNDPDALTPFSGIIRAVVAIFLIPATQLIISYMVDVGNSMAYEVKKWVDLPTITGYAHEQQYRPQRDMTNNCLAPMKTTSQDQSSTNTSTDGGGMSLGSVIGALSGGLSGILSLIVSMCTSVFGVGQEYLGKAYGGPEAKAIEEVMPQLSKQIQVMYNLFNVCASTGVVVLADFQLVMMCYLFLMGPIAAAFYAWPNVKAASGDSPGIFNKIFGNWLQSVITLSLWRFWWMVVLACLTTYIQWSQQMGYFDPHSEWEMMIFTSFQVLLLTVPFAPFDFKGKEQIERIQNISEDKTKGGDSGKGSSKS